ncbi:single-strand DNA-binding protein [Luteimonas cucumeris]|uniref:Single-stranded DNA-binding protein n=1 Tax=Luteimonas cucumeris TaxID=985012 RepID=A0A562LB65_9GAMM|nr:single-stranded DNA-binding protein [Luteimonas cucumeris]TWI04848.1 single-strand DNA-binding protein [Luteimonas cucumeris]
MNNCTFIGRVGKDAATRFTQGGDPVTGWSLAVDSGYGDKKQTLWLDCSLWGKRGEKVAEYITKGSQLGATGELGTREHDGKTYLTLRVAEVSLIGGKPEGAQRQRQEPKPAPSEMQDDDIPF